MWWHKLSRLIISCALCPTVCLICQRVKRSKLAAWLTLRLLTKRTDQLFAARSVFVLRWLELWSGRWYRLICYCTTWSFCLRGAARSHTGYYGWIEKKQITSACNISVFLIRNRNLSILFYLVWVIKKFFWCFFSTWECSVLIALQKLCFYTGDLNSSFNS